MMSEGVETAARVPLCLNKILYAPYGLYQGTLGLHTEASEVERRQTFMVSSCEVLID